MEPVVINETGLSEEEINELRKMGFEVADQGSEAWLEERLGLVTASKVFDIIDWTAGSAPRKSDGVVTTQPKPKASYYTYMNQLLGERMTGSSPRFSSKPIEWGRSHEEEAANVYEQMTGYDVRTVGFMKLDDIEAGASLDRTVGEDATVEIKCPNTSTHINYIFSGIPPQYYAQMQMQFWVSGRKWGHFFSYDPEMEGGAKVYMELIERDDTYIADMESKVVEFLSRVHEKELRLRELANG